MTAPIIILVHPYFSVTPAQAGVPFGLEKKRDPRFRGDDTAVVLQVIS